MDTIQIDINLLIHLCLLRVLFLNPFEKNNSYVNMFSLPCGLFQSFCWCRDLNTAELSIAKMKYCALICCMILYVFSFASGKKIKPPIPDELKEACKGAGGGRRSCLDEKLKEYCVNPSNIDTITCKIVRLKTLIPDSIAGFYLHLKNINRHEFLVLDQC